MSETEPNPPADVAWDAARDATWVVAGNGPSAANILPGRVLETDRIVRINNFFFETDFHLGHRVDLAVMAGDPRVAPFMWATLKSCLGDYDLKAWTSHDPRVIRAAPRALRPRYRDVSLRNGPVAEGLAALVARFGKTPTTGMRAVLAAHALGARRIVLTGIDLYAAGPRYAFTPGRHMRDLMGDDIGSRGMDARLHDAALDRAVLELLLAQPDLSIWRASEAGGFADLLDVAPAREGPALVPAPRRNPPRDWVGRSGLYPIGMLKLMRRLRARSRSFRHET